MNQLEQAAELIENGWCTGRLRNGDGKYCSVGAVLAVNGISEDELNRESFDECRGGVLNPYQFADKLPEIKALADEILANDDEGEYAGNNLADIVYFWNDKQTDVNDVLEMFKYAAKRL